MSEKAELLERIQEHEHVIVQLSVETETIGMCEREKEREGGVRDRETGREGDGGRERESQFFFSLQANTLLSIRLRESP